MKICFASHNKHKINELNQMLDGIHEVIGLTDLNVVSEIPETGKTFEENSRIKAKYIYERFKMPVFADDSGLCVQALNGEPGVYSARYAGNEKNDQKNIDLLLTKLGESKNRKAYFATVITYIDRLGNENQFYGQVDGTILKKRTGAEGFGYDPVFQPDGYATSFAEMSLDKKNRISHRALAVQKLIDHLASHG